MVFGIGNQFAIANALGQGCRGGGCHPASGAYSGVYNSHTAPYQGVQMGSLPPGFNVLQPGLNQPVRGGTPSVMGKDPIGNYMITQSVPTPNVDFTYARPQVGANSTVRDLGLMWEICQPIGLFGQQVCRKEAKVFPPQPQPYQKVTVPVVTPPYNGGRPQVGANATVTDMGLTWQICEPVDFGLFRQMNCRTQPKFQ